MNERNRFEELHYALTASLYALPPTGCSIILALAAYRNSWQYHKFEVASGKDGMSKIIPILDQIFDGAVLGEKPNGETLREREERLLSLTPDSEERFLASGAIDFASLINAAQTRLSHGEFSNVDQEPDTVFYYLSGYMSFVGDELFGCLAPGNANPQFTKLFYEKVLADYRCVRAVECLQNDIADIATCSSGDYTSVAYTLRDNALADAQEFLKMMGETK